MSICFFIISCRTGGISTKREITTVSDDETSKEGNKFIEERITGTAVLPQIETTVPPEEKENATIVLRAYLDSVVEGVNEDSWTLSSGRFHEEVIETFSEDESTKEAFFKSLKEGVAHEKLLSYEILESVVSLEKAYFLILAERENMDKEIYKVKDKFKLIKEEGEWRVDGGF